MVFGLLSSKKPDYKALDDFVQRYESFAVTAENRAGVAAHLNSLAGKKYIHISKDCCPLNNDSHFNHGFKKVKKIDQDDFRGMRVVVESESIGCKSTTEIGEILEGETNISPIYSGDRKNIVGLLMSRKSAEGTKAYSFSDLLLEYRFCQNNFNELSKEASKVSRKNKFGI